MDSKERSQTHEQVTPVLPSQQREYDNRGHQLMNLKEGWPTSWFLLGGPARENKRRDSDASKDQVQRVSQYDKVLHNLLENSSGPGARHPRDYESLLDSAQIVREMVKEREEEMTQAENESRLLQVQERFPHDELNLLGVKETTKVQKFKALSTRRRSAPTTVIRSALVTSKLKTVQDKSNNNSPPDSILSLDLGSLPSSLSIPASSRDIPSPTADAPVCKTRYMMEGPVQVSVGIHTQSRYLILTSETLIIAKQKSSNSFRLKYRPRVGELWLSTCLEEVSEVIKSHDCSFVLGWPTANVVLTFGSNQERELWWQSLSRIIESKRKEGDGKKVQVRVLIRDSEYTAFPSKTLQISNDLQSKDLLIMAMQEFGLSEDVQGDYQLWVQSGREDSLYPLIGHEYPHAIKMSHIRDVQDKQEDAVFTSEMDQLSSAENELREHQCQFIMRKKSKSGSGLSIDTSAIQRRLKKGRKSPFKISFKRSVSNRDGTSPGSSPLSPHSRLFGLPLSMVCPDNNLPKPVMDLLTTLYHQAPFVTGVFRKSANARVCRQLRETLDAGEQTSLDDVSVHVAASVLKDFLRSLPDSLLVCSQCDEWISTNDITGKVDKLDAITSLIEQLLDINRVLLRHLFCVLHYVALHMDENNMTSYNLAICVAPSMLWPPINADPVTQALATKKIPSVVEFMIDNVKEVFGEDVLTLFGDPPIHRSEHRRHDSSGDSDSMNEVSPFIKRDDSSLDSIEKEFYATENEQDQGIASHKWPYNNPVLSPSSLSRDSGITSSDNQLYPDSDNTDTTDSGMESKEKFSGGLGMNTRPLKTSQFGNTDDLFWKQRRGSEPSSLSQAALRKRVSPNYGLGDNAGTNSPDLSDHEYNLSEDTLKLIKDLSKECSSKLLSDMLHADTRANSQWSVSNGSTVTISGEGFSEGTGDPNSAIPCVRRQSVPSIESGSPTFPRRLTASRRSASSMSSSSSERMSDAQSSSSSERLHSSKFGTSQRTEIDMAKTLQAASTNPGQMSSRGRPKVGQHGLQPSYKKLFMNQDTCGLPSRPMGAPPRNGKVSRTKEATPPREFFPKDATSRSTLSQSPRALATHREQREKTSPEKQKSSLAGQHSKQRVSKTQSDSTSMSSSSHSTPPTYQEAMNRRALLQHQTNSFDSAAVQPVNEHVSRTRSGDGSAAKHRHEERLGKTKRHMIAGGIIFIGSDSDSSDDGDFRSSNSSAKNRGVRRTSSDSVATNRKGSVTSVQRSSSDTAKPGNDVQTKHQQHNADHARKSTHQSPRRRHLNGEGPRRTSGGNHPSRRLNDSSNVSSSSSDPVSGCTALHFPFPDPRADPPSSPVISSRSRTIVKDTKKVQANAQEADQAVTKARRSWQQRKVPYGSDLKFTVQDLENIHYTDESYV